MGISSGAGSENGDPVDYKPRKVTPTVGWSSGSKRLADSGGPGLDRGLEAPWRLSSRKEKVDGGVQELLGNPVAELGEMKGFDQMVSGVQRMREMQRKEGSLLDLTKTPRHRKFTRLRPRNGGKVGAESSGSSSNGSEDCSFSVTDFKEIDELPPELFSEEEQIAQLKAEDLKNERQRKTLYLSSRSPKRRGRQSCRIRIRSPRATREGKPNGKRRSKEKGNGLERFAVIKCSFNPQQDFRDSMIEMILERGIRKPEELEELLACYLTLNSDEYHDIIIEVFRQLWFEMNRPLAAS